MAISIREVKTKSDLKAFINLPLKIYRNYPLWVPPIWNDEKKLYNKKNNPVLAHSDYVMYLVYDENDVIGRNIAYIDFNYNSYYKSKTGFFGSFECADNYSAAYALIEKAETILREKGMVKILGPVNPVAENWGFLVKGFHSSPVFMAPYNPFYYNDFFTKAGYGKAKDLLAYEANSRTGYNMPQRFVDFSDKLLSRHPNLTVRKLNRKELLKDGEEIWKITNISLRNNWGYVPLNRDEFLDMFKKLKVIVDPDAVWLVEDEGKMIGYALGFPDVNIIIKQIKGRLFPFGFLKMIFGAKHLKDYRLFGLAVLPQYHNRAMDVLLYLNLYTALKPKITRLEANYILEDNPNIRNALEKLDLKHIKTYRVYEKKLK